MNVGKEVIIQISFMRWECFYLQIATASALEPLRTSNIIDVVLTGNPICERQRDAASYVRYPFDEFSFRLTIFLNFSFFQAYG